MSSKITVCLLVALGASLTSAQSVSLGNCDSSITALDDFDAAAYLGRWFEYAKSFALFELGGKCITADYSLNDDGSVAVTNTQYNTITSQNSNIVGSATFDKNSSVAELTVTFPSVPVPAPYWVLDTDYENYAIVYSCYEVLLVKSTNLWILTRSSSPSEEVIKKAYAAIESFGLDTSVLSQTDQTDCTYASA